MEFSLLPDPLRVRSHMEGSAQTEWIVILNWFEELKRLVPTP